ncbi:hypothetical protein ABW21_db0204934 [Orbilia brochopaga]|nr:hypothetical protein ABW21_db0204934 [Drechslerella brochopaga]
MRTAQSNGHLNGHANLQPESPSSDPLPVLTITAATASLLIREIEDYEFTMFRLRHEISPHIPPSLDDLATIKYHLSGLLQSLRSILPHVHHSESDPFNELLTELSRSLESLEIMHPPRPSANGISFSTSIQYGWILESTNMKLKKFKDMALGYTFVDIPSSPESVDILSTLLPTVTITRIGPGLVERPRVTVDSVSSSSSEAPKSHLSIIPNFFNKLRPFGTADTTPDTAPIKQNGTANGAASRHPTDPIRIRTPPPSLPIPIPKVPSNPLAKAATDTYRRHLRDQPREILRKKLLPVQTARPNLLRQRTRDPKERAAHIRRMKEANDRATKQQAANGAEATTTHTNGRPPLPTALESTNQFSNQKRQQPQRSHSRNRPHSPSRLAQVENVAISAANTAMDVLSFSHWKKQKAKSPSQPQNSSSA